MIFVAPSKAGTVCEEVKSVKCQWHPPQDVLGHLKYTVERACAVDSDGDPSS